MILIAIAISATILLLLIILLLKQRQRKYRNIKNAKQQKIESNSNIKAEQKNTQLLMIIGVIIVFICCIALGMFFFMKLK